MTTTLLIVLTIACDSIVAYPLDIILPTSNDAIYRGDDSTFYMNTANSRKEPWAAGKFGFVRNPRSTKEGMIHLRHHAGIDIRPLYRDEKGRPLDSVVAVADGIVVYTNDRAGYSNYGKYVVVEHVWDGAPYYSLYAHLNEVWADSGAHVEQGALLGRLGYTGPGVNRQRAHLHFEINLLLSEHFDSWFTLGYRGDVNRHGAYNGLNMMAVDVGRLYLALRDNPALTMPQFIAEEHPYYSVSVPRDAHIDMLNRYPWLLAEPMTDHHNSWTIFFARHGLPLRVEPSTKLVDKPSPYVVSPSKLPYRWLTKSIIAGYGENYSLSHAGHRLIELMLAPPPLPATAAEAE
ncbi:MAG: M23 family metallopeptidase [bacterium]|nr:M23 family metallopeptidase [Candidatus Kapabacteria bacterium]